MPDKYNVVSIDRIEDDEWEGEPRLKLVDKSGTEWKLGKPIIPKYDWVKSLPIGTAVKLTMAKFTKNGQEIEYVKDIEQALGLLADKVAEKLAPVKNLKDISIEAQVAVKCVSDMMVSGKVTVPDDIKEIAFEWIRKALGEANK
jgi:hypothetical protein